MGQVVKKDFEEAKKDNEWVECVHYCARIERKKRIIGRASECI